MPRTIRLPDEPALILPPSEIKFAALTDLLEREGAIGPRDWRLEARR